MLALLLVACGPPAPPVDPTLPPLTPATEACAAYHDALGPYAVCVTRLATAELDPSVAAPLCASLPAPRADECRRAWVEHRLNEPTRPPVDQLLTMCGPLPDCSFRVLDEYPSADAATQLDLCARYAGPYVGDCAGHALQRWADTAPDDDEVARLWGPASKWPDRYGTAVAQVRWCAGRRLDGTPAGDEAAGCPKDTFARTSCLGALRAAQRDQTPCRGR